MTWAVKPDPTAELRKKVEELEKAVGMAVEQIAKLTRDLHYAIMESSSRPYYVREPRYEPVPPPYVPYMPYVPHMPDYLPFLPEPIKPSSKKEEG